MGNNAMIWIILFQIIKLSDISPTDKRIHSWSYQSSGWDFKRGNPGRTSNRIKEEGVHWTSRQSAPTGIRKSKT